MTLPTPPRYVVVPEEVIDQAFAPKKARRALLGSFVRILSLAWEAKYQKTPMLDEVELMEFLKLSRRQYFEQKADMELVGWLRSSHPRPGFVQFSFSRAISEKVAEQAVSAENPDSMQKNAPLMNEEEESLNLKALKDSSSSSVKSVRFSALNPSEQKMRLLIEHLRLLFEPERHGILDMRESFLVGIPERALGWIAKAYQDRSRLDNPIGMIVKHINLQDAPDRYYMENFREVLPEEYLEAVDEIEYECAFCEEKFKTRSQLQQHGEEKHPFACSECDAWFLTREEMRSHFEDCHLNGRDVPVSFAVDGSVRQPIGEGKITPEQAWQSVLDQLQMEIPRASFDTCVRDTEPIRYGGNTLSIGVRNSYARDWLESRLASTVSRLLVGILNASVCVEFVVAETEAEE
jgi:hypothetical protein